MRKLLLKTIRRSILALLVPLAIAQDSLPITGWQLQDAVKVAAQPAVVSTAGFRPDAWYAATVPGTILTTLVDNHVYPEPLYGENMRAIPESLNRTTWWYRTSIPIAPALKGRHIWLHFAGINYAAEIWVNGQRAGTTRGAFIRGDFEITPYVRVGHPAVVAVLVSPQPHPGIPHEHTVANGVGKNGGDTALDGPTFLSTIGWDWLPAIRDRDTGIWLPVTVTTTGPVRVQDPIVTTELAPTHDTARLNLSATLQNLTTAPVTGTAIATISALGIEALILRQAITLPPSATTPVLFNPTTLTQPKLWWPNGYGPQNLYTTTVAFEPDSKARLKPVSDTQRTTFGIRHIDYQVADSENLTISVNGVRIMVRGGNWGLDEGLKRIPRTRLDAQFHMHALANMNLIRNWVGQSTGPDFYELADKYGILLWDEFFQPNPSDGPNPDDLPTYLANVTDKVVRYRNHPSIAVWCARNEGYPPKALDDTLKGMMAKLDPTRLYQSNSADGRGVSSHGPYYWRAPRYFYALNESFKTETGSVSIPTLESIQGMMPEKDWETQNDDWAQHDLARGAQRGDQFPAILAKRYGPIRNLADFARKGQLANYEAYRAMYESRNAQMFKTTTGVITWMSHPAQPSFVWQLYHYDLEPNSSLYAVKKAAETIHVQLNESNGGLEVVNNTPAPLTGLSLRTTVYDINSKQTAGVTNPVPEVPPSTTLKVAQVTLDGRNTPVYFTKLDLTDAAGKLLSTNFYWQNGAQDDFTSLAQLPSAALTAAAASTTQGDNTVLTVTLANPTPTIALMAHLQLRGKASNRRILPAFPSDNYITLVPGETRTLTIEVPTAALGTDIPHLLLDGYNVALASGSSSSVSVALNQNTQPANTPASKLVP